MTKNILHNIEKNMSSFSKGQKLIARFILENYDKAAFMRLPSQVINFLFAIIVV